MFTHPKFLFSAARILDEVAARVAEKRRAIEIKQEIARLEREYRERLHSYEAHFRESRERFRSAP
jgi:hypothetical protein